jgi:hypothetical protein
MSHVSVSVPLDCNREDVLEQLQLFLDSESIELIGIRLNNNQSERKAESLFS